MIINNQTMQIHQRLRYIHLILTIHFILLLKFSGAQVQSINDNLLPFTGSNLQLVPALSYMTGYTTYRINAQGILSNVNNEKVFLKSELKFPLHSWLAGGELKYCFPINGIHSLNLSIGAYLDIKNGTGQMVDQDWINDIQVGYSKSKEIQLDVFQVNFASTYDLLKTYYSNIRVITRLNYQKWEQWTFGYQGWLIDYESGILREINGDDPTIDYQVRYLSTQIGLELRTRIFASSILELDAAGGVVWSEDRDDHLLRGKIAEGSAKGPALSAKLNFSNVLAYMGNHALFIDLFGAINYYYTEGSQNQEWYRDEGSIPAGYEISGIPLKIESLQYIAGIRLGINFNLFKESKNDLSHVGPVHSVADFDRQGILSYTLTSTDLILNWQEKDGITGYNLYSRIGREGKWENVFGRSLTENLVKFKRPVKAKLYQFVVTVIINGNEMDYSGIIDVEIK
jgi:outer membrane protease